MSKQFNCKKKASERFLLNAIERKRKETTILAISENVCTLTLGKKLLDAVFDYIFYVQ